jgi:hypothetical protein
MPEDRRAAGATGHGGLAWELVWPALVLLLLAGAAAALVALQATSQTLVRQAERRAAVVLTDIVRDVEARLNLGLRLAELRDVQDLLERERAKDDRILTVEVFDAAGRSLFSTDRTLIGNQVPEQWRRLAQQGGPLWLTTDFEAAVIGVPIRNSFERVVGSAVLRYARSAFAATETALQERIVATAGIAAAVAAAVLAALAWLAVMPERRLLCAARSLTLDAAPATPPAIARQFGDIAGAAWRLDRLDGEIAAASAAIQRVDDDA